MKKFNILHGKEIELDDKINNSFLLYNTIYTNNYHLNDKLISFCTNVFYSGILYIVEENYLLLEIYHNIINSKTQDIDFTLKNKIKLELSSLEYHFTPEEEIQMYFLSGKYILLENVLKRTIILDHENGSFVNIILRGKKTQRKNLLYNPGQTSGDDLFKDDSNENERYDLYKDKENINDKNNTLINKLRSSKNVKKNEKNSVSHSVDSSFDDLSNQDISFLTKNFNTLKILYVFDEHYHKSLEKKNDINMTNNNISNITNLNLNNNINNNNDISTISNNNINNINLSSNDKSNNNSFIFSNKYKQNVNKVSNPNTNIENNLETITSNDASSTNLRNENKKENITANLTTLTTNIATIPSSNQNTIEETKIMFNMQNKSKTQTFRRSYIFLMDKNELYYCLIDDTFDLNQILEFKQVAFVLDENDLILEMKIIKIYKNDKVSYIFFLLSKYGLIIIPTDFGRITLKNIILNNGYNRSNSFKVYYKLDYIQDPLNFYHMVINYKNPSNSKVYILNKNNVITIELDLNNLRKFVKEEIYKICCDPNTNYELGVEEKIVLKDNSTAFVNKKKKVISFNKKNYNIKEIKVQGYITSVEEFDGNFIIYDKTSKSLEIYYINGNYFDKVSNYKDVDLIFFFSFPKIYSIFFCMNNTFNKISFNKKLYWYSEYFSNCLDSPSKSSFDLPYLEEYIYEIKENYLSNIFSYNDNKKVQNTESEIQKEIDKSLFSEFDIDKSINSSKEKSSLMIRNCEFCEKEIYINSNIKKENSQNENENINKNNSEEIHNINNINNNDSNINIIDNKNNDIDNNISNKNNYFECKNKNCKAVYCCEEHRDMDYKAFHFFHCKLKNFFINYEYTTQINFFNDLIILISDIIKYIFNNIFCKDDYLFYLPYIKIITFLLKTLNMKYLSDMVVDYSQKMQITKDELISLLFYQEVIFFYYNLILLSLNFGIRCDLLEFVKKELDFLSEDEEQFFNKEFLTSTIFNRNTHFYQQYIDFSNYKYFFIDEEYLSKSNFLRQNDILFTKVIHLYANYIHLTDRLCKDNPLNLVYLNPFTVKIVSQLIVFFEERNRESPDETYVHFISLITPYLTLNRKMLLANKILEKVIKLMENSDLGDSIFKVVTNHNLGLIKYSTGAHLEGIHNIENSYKLILDNDYSYLLRIKIVERLALAYLNIGELLKSFILIKEAIFLRTNLLNLYESNPNFSFLDSMPINKNDYLYQHYFLLSNNISSKKINYYNLYSQNKEKPIDDKNNKGGYIENKSAYYENSMQLVHLFSYINYIQDFVEYEYQMKHMKEKGKKNNYMSKREYQIYLINYVLGKEDLNAKNKNFSIIDNYSEDYFRAIEFLYSLNKNILATLDNDNQTKKNIINKDENIPQSNPNNILSPSHLSHSNTDENMQNNNNMTINNSKKHGQFDNNNLNNININNPFINNQIKDFTDKDTNLDYDNDIEIKEDLFEQLSKNEQLTLTSINTKYFNRNILLRDYYGPINLFNINYHPIYTKEFKKIISKSKHQFFVKILTQASSAEITNYFFPTSNTNLEGLSKYLQQEEIQNMYKVEKTKILSLLKDENNNKKYKRVSADGKIFDINEFEKYQKKKENWINSIKRQLLKEGNRSMQEIDQALINLYDNLNDEYKEEIEKNPELILYYIFTDIGTSNTYTTTFHIRKSAIEDDFNNIPNFSKRNSSLYYNNIEDRPGFRFSMIRNSIKDDENNNSFKKKKKKISNLKVPGIPEERKLIFSDDSNSSSEENVKKNNQNNERSVKFNLPSKKGKKLDNLISMPEVSERSEND